METLWRHGEVVSVVSPMVDQSEFAFRELCRRYGAQLCYTPMIHAKLFLSDPTYRSQRLEMDLLESNQPVVVQFASDDPSTLLEAARLIEGRAGLEQGELRQRRLSRLCPPVHQARRFSDARVAAATGAGFVDRTLATTARFGEPAMTEPLKGLLQRVAQRTVTDLTRDACE